MLHRQPKTINGSMRFSAIPSCFRFRLDHLVATVRNSSSQSANIELPPLLREVGPVVPEGGCAGGRKIDVEIVCDQRFPWFESIRAG